MSPFLSITTDDEHGDYRFDDRRRESRRVLEIALRHAYSEGVDNRTISSRGSTDASYAVILALNLLILLGLGIVCGGFPQICK